MIKLYQLLLNATARLFPHWNGAVAFKTLCRVKRTATDSSSNAFLDTAQQASLAIDDYKATLYSWGTGKKRLLLLHGWKSHSARWESLVLQLDLKEYTVFAIDAPAHGRSAGNSLHLEIYRRFVVQTIEMHTSFHAIVGHSLGGLVTAYAYLNDHQLPVSKFIISGAPSGMQSIYDFFKRVVTLDDLVIENMDRHIKEHVTQLPPREIRLDRFFDRVQIPTMVIHDEQDRICPIKPIKSALQRHPEIQTKFTTGLGHDLLDEQVDNSIIQFVKS
jgi:pimeloyl-ACP methyl ester carboxylesterase